MYLIILLMYQGWFPIIFWPHVFNLFLQIKYIGNKMSLQQNEQNRPQTITVVIKTEKNRTELMIQTKKNRTEQNLNRIELLYIDSGCTEMN
jgi:hypothetical protein